MKFSSIVVIDTLACSGEYTIIPINRFRKIGIFYIIEN
nr:MAG TPA: hypothetical protein [Caudoviricetes sp.]